MKRYIEQESQTKALLSFGVWGSGWYYMQAFWFTNLKTLHIPFFGLLQKSHYLGMADKIVGHWKLIELLAPHLFQEIRGWI